MPYQKKQSAFKGNFGKRRCHFCTKKIEVIDYKDSQLLSRYLTAWAKIKPHSNTGNCAKHQRRLAEAVKRARYLAILPYVKR
jgi:small subunit ribosomal protein S18